MAERDAEAILAIDPIGWTRDNLLFDLPEKWALSFVVWPGLTAYAVLSRKETGVHLHHLAVSPNIRGNGLGARMLAECLYRGVRTLKVHRTNRGAIRFYERHGFEFTSGGEYRWMRLGAPT